MELNEGSAAASENLERTLKSMTVLLESSIGTAPSLQGVDSIMQSLLLRLVRDGEHNQATRLANLVAPLKIDTAISQDSLWSILYILSSLKGTANASNSAFDAAGTTAKNIVSNGSHRRTPAPASAFAEVLFREGLVALRLALLFESLKLLKNPSKKISLWIQSRIAFIMNLISCQIFSS